MAGAERRGSMERITQFSKMADVIGVITGLIVGGQAGLALIMISGITYYVADRFEKGRSK